MADITGIKQKVLNYGHEAAPSLAGFISRFDMIRGQAVAMGLETSPGVLDQSKWADSTSDPLKGGDFGLFPSVFAGLAVADVAALWQAFYTLRTSVTSQQMATILKWLP